MWDRESRHEKGAERGLVCHCKTEKVGMRGKQKGLEVYETEKVGIRRLVYDCKMEKVSIQRQERGLVYNCNTESRHEDKGEGCCMTVRQNMGSDMPV